MTDNIKIGKMIALLRSQKGITQAELGERLGVSFQAVSKWEIIAIFFYISPPCYV